MKSLLLFSIFTAMALAFPGDASMSSVKESSEAMQSKPIFSSRYTSLIGRGCGSGMTKAEEREAEATGTDLPTICKGPRGYAIHVGYSACSAQISVEKGMESTPLVMQSGTSNKTQWNGEWPSHTARPYPSP